MELFNISLSAYDLLFLKRVKLISGTRFELNIIKQYLGNYELISTLKRIKSEPLSC